MKFIVHAHAQKIKYSLQNNKKKKVAMHVSIVHVEEYMLIILNRGKQNLIFRTKMDVNKSVKMRR